MLMIAIPKSASTALMETVARAQRLNCDMHYRWDRKPSAEFTAFHIQHQFGWELTDEAVAEFIRPDVLHKSHILPSRNNLHRLEAYEKVVLLRDPAGIIGAYKRGQDTGVYPQKTDVFADCVSLDDWMQRADEIGLLEEFQRFCDAWVSAESDKLVVWFEDLMRDPGREIARIEKYFRWPLSGTASLLKRKYTRLGDQSLDYHKRTFETWKRSTETDENLPHPPSES